MEKPRIALNCSAPFGQIQYAVGVQFSSCYLCGELKQVECLLAVFLRFSCVFHLTVCVCHTSEKNDKIFQMVS